MGGGGGGWGGNICYPSIIIMCDFKQLQYGPRRKKTCLWWFAKNKGADQPAHPGSLISASIIRLL